MAWVISKKNSPFWHARWEHPDEVQPSGKPVIISRSTGETGKRAAEKRATELETEWLEGHRKHLRGGSVTSDHVIEEYWESEGKFLKSARSHVYCHLERIDQFLGNRPYCDVSIADVAKFVDGLRGTLGDATINRNLSVWRRMHNVATKKRLYPVKFIHWGEVRLRENDAPARAIDAATLRAITEHLPEHAQEVVWFALETGIRKAQIYALSWDRVDMARGCVTIYRKHHRAQQEYTVFITDRAIEILKRRWQPDASGRVFDTKNLRKLWDKAVRLAGETTRFHDLRHTFAFRAHARLPSTTVQALLGVSDLRLVERYAKAGQSALMDAARRLSED